MAQGGDSETVQICEVWYSIWNTNMSSLDHIEGIEVLLVSHIYWSTRYKLYASCTQQEPDLGDL